MASVGTRRHGEEIVLVEVVDWFIFRVLQVEFEKYIAECFVCLTAFVNCILLFTQISQI